MAAMTSEEEEGGGKNLMAALLIHKESNCQNTPTDIISYRSDGACGLGWGRKNKRKLVG
jgi:hypothetical protein